MAVLDLVSCPICHARDSLARHTTKLESRTHVAYECLQCGTQLVWLGDEMWLEADRWSFQKVGRPERADLLFRSMTAAELRKLAGEQPPYKAPPVKPAQAIPPPVWIEMTPTAEESPDEPLPEGYGAEAVGEQGLPPARVEGAAILPRAERQAEAVQAVVEPEPAPEPLRPVVHEPPPKAAADATAVGAATPGRTEAVPAVERPVAEPEPQAKAGAEPAPAVERPPAEPEPPVEAGVDLAVVAGGGEQEEATQEAPRPAIQEPSLASEKGAAGLNAAVFVQEGAAPVAERRAAAEPRVETVPAEPIARPAVVQPAVVEEALPPGDAPEVRQPPVRSTRQRRRSRGSPFLVISVGLVLLCLICSAAAMVIYSMWERLPPGAGQPASPAASEAQAVETVLPTDTALPTETVLPTDIVLPTVTQVPTPTASPVPTETAPAPASGVEFQGVTDYLSATGSHYLVGEVINRTVDTLRFVEVLATFHEGGGQVVGSGSTFTELSIIEPGSTAPFKMATPDLPDGWTYDLRVDYSTTGESPIRLEVMGHSGSTADDGRYHVTGEVRNPHGFNIKFPEIVVTYYNAAHEVVRVEVDFAEVDPLEPGQSSAFEVVLTDPPGDLMHYTLQTEAVEQ